MNRAKHAVDGVSKNGDPIEAISLRGPDHMTATILPLGARLLDVRLANGPSLVSTFSTLKEVEADTAYTNVAVGRVANRIKNARYGDIILDNNSGAHQLHGGRSSWDKRLWNVAHRTTSSVVLTLSSPHNDQGYPSSVEVTVTYELRGNGELYVSLKTHNSGDETTITNMTLHPYFDLRAQSAVGAASDYILHAPHCDQILELDRENLPTGVLQCVEGTRFDLRTPRALSDANGTYDNYFVCNDYTSGATDALREVLVVTAPATSRSPAISLHVLTNQRGFQLYTPPGLRTLAIEPSEFIDAPSNANFPSIELPPGRTRDQRIVYRFTRPAWPPSGGSTPA